MSLDESREIGSGVEKSPTRSRFSCGVGREWIDPSPGFGEHECKARYLWGWKGADRPVSWFRRV